MKNYMNKIINNVITEYINHISSIDEVTQIYLFGSHAYGEPTEYSDIDLMVIVDDNYDSVKTAIKIQKNLLSRVVHLDVLVNKKSIFFEAAKEPTIQRQIKNEGILLYDK